MINKRFGSLSSSENPSELAATVKAAILAISSLVIMVSSKYGLGITQDTMIEIATQLGLAISSIYFLFGILRKIIIKIAE